jgi:hypothetical protein
MANPEKRRPRNPHDVCDALRMVGCARSPERR